ncbi:MAG: hypothetical protein SFT81_02240 [Candidatus Caenarcaniphilales bacterium]|nr:hypothetical protein [Candidatus Caenarcaniphilales bacterium]
MSSVSSVTTFRSVPSAYVQSQSVAGSSSVDDNPIFKNLVYPAADKLEVFKEYVSEVKGPVGWLLRLLYPVQTNEMRFISEHGLTGMGGLSDVGGMFNILLRNRFFPEYVNKQGGNAFIRWIKGLLPSFTDKKHQEVWNEIKSRTFDNPNEQTLIDALKEAERSVFHKEGTSVSKVSQTFTNFAAWNNLSTWGGFIFASNIGQRIIGTVSGDLDQGNTLAARIKTFISFALFGISSVLIGRNVVSSNSAALIDNKWVRSLLTLNTVPLILSHIIDPVFKALAGLIDPAGTLGRSERKGWLSNILNSASDLFGWMRASSLIAFSANHHAHQVSAQRAMDKLDQTPRATWTEEQLGKYKSHQFSKRFNRIAKWSQASAIFTMVIGQVLSSVIENRYKNFEKKFKPLQEALEQYYDAKLDQIRQAYQSKKITRAQAEKLLQQLQAEIQAIYQNKLQPIYEQGIKPIQRLQWVSGLFNEYTNVAMMGSMFLNGFVSASQEALSSYPKLGYRKALFQYLGSDKLQNPLDRIQPFIGLGGLTAQVVTGVPLAIFSNGSPLAGKLGKFGEILEALDKNPNFQLLKDITWAV